MFDSKHYGLLVGLIVLVGLARPALAFGAGNIASISKVEGENWRHGDIEDALLALTLARCIGDKRFNKLNVARVYFGNWLRDYSQAIDVGTVKNVSAEAIRLLLCVLGFITFGYGSKEFEVTADRLGCYRPEDHIDNPKNYADNEDARQYDRRLRGPVDERVELAVDGNSGMKNYIANEGAGIMTSAQHVRNLFGRAIELGRSSGRSGNKAEKYEALRLLGTGLHCLEDFFAHSNYTELALAEMGERDIFPHVGRDTRLRINGARGDVYPLVTGTFGGVDFLHSVTGEVSDKLTQNEIEELEGTLNETKTSDTSILRGLLDKIPDGIFGGDQKPSSKVDQIQENTVSSQLQNTQVSPREPEEYTLYIKQIFEQIQPVIDFHDEIMKSISAAMERIPLLPKILEELEEQLLMFVFSNIAPFIVPVIHQIRNELRTGSEEIVESSKREQHIVFHDDRCTDPTHSMLSKDHFTNILNEIAGRTAAEMVTWVVPQVMQAMDDEGTDVNRTLNRIIYGVMHHPAQRDMGDDGARDGRQRIFHTVEQWWQGMDEGQRSDYRRKLSREGVEAGENHKEGQHDTGHGHGCNGKLKVHKEFGPPDTMQDKIAGAAAGAILAGATGAISSAVQSQTGYKLPTYERPQEESFSSGGLGGILGNVLGFNKSETETHSSSRHDDDGSYTRTETTYGHSGDRYGQAEVSETRYGDGGGRSEYREYGQQDHYGGRQSSGYGYEETTESRPSYGGGYEERTERHRWEGSTEEESSYSRRNEEESSYSRRNEEESSYSRRDEEESSYSRRDDEEQEGGGGLGEFMRVAKDAYRRTEERGGW